MEKLKKKRVYRILFHFHYPKLFLFLCFITLAYFIFKNEFIFNSLSSLTDLSYFGVFLAGMLFTFGFTSPIAVGLLIALNPSNIFLAGVIGGFGALISDLLIFKFIRFSFMDEFKRLEKNKVIVEINYLFENYLGHKIKTYFMYVFAGLLIASPLPDEAGIIMLAGLTKIKPWIFALLSIILNTIGIILILMI